MADIVALYGSPRRKGNTATLLDRAVQGARDEGAAVERIFLRDLQISPCLEIYACTKDGECAIQDDYQTVQKKLLDAQGIMLASPIFFYTVSAHTKALMDRSQCLWVKKYWIDGVEFGKGTFRRKGLFVSAGASHGKRLFEGVLLTVKYFFDVFDAELWEKLLYRGLDQRHDAEKHPEYLEEAYTTGRRMAREIS